MEVTRLLLFHGKRLVIDELDCPLYRKGLSEDIMYCSTCGSAVSAGLAYCNRCGAELSNQHNSTKLSATSMESLVWAIATVTIVGMGAVIGLMAVMKEVLHFSDLLILIFSLLFLAAFMGVDLVFIRLLYSKFGVRRNPSPTPRAELRTKDLDEPKVRTLSEAPASVAEHTTRTLETADRERHTQ